MKYLKIVQIPEDELKTIVTDALRAELTILKTIEPVKETNEILTRQQAAKLLQCSLVTLDKWTKTGVLVGYRISGRVRYKSNEVENALIKIQTLKISS